MAINALIRGDYDQAAAGFRQTIDIDPDWTWGYIKLGRTLSLQKKCKEALVQTEIAERRIAGGAAPFSRSWLGSTYANCGDIARARQKLAEMHAIEATAMSIRQLSPESTPASARWMRPSVGIRRR